MTFAEPLYILAGISAVALYALAVVITGRKKAAAMAKFAQYQQAEPFLRHLSPRKYTAKMILLALAIFFLFLALARPQSGSEWVDVKRRGIDILIAIDASKSMDAQDIRPSRLERSKLAVLDLVDQLDGDRIGLMAFAGSAYLMCPLTIDYDVFRQTLLAADTSVVPNKGTNIAQAITRAETILNNDANHKLLIIITDGENLQGNLDLAASRAAEQKMTIFTVGVGTKAGELIPTGSEEGGFLKDENGHWVTSKLDEAALQLIAQSTGGIYAPLGTSGEGLSTIYNRKLQLIPKTEISERRTSVPIERFHYPLGMALFLLICEFLLSRRPGAITISALLPRKSRLFTLLLSFVFLSLTVVPGVQASSGENLYAEKDYAAARKHYQLMLEKDPENTRLHFNSGSAAYKNNEFEEAQHAFTRALATSDVDLQEMSYFNLGNTLYRLGEQQLNQNPQQTREQWQNALSAFDNCLSLAPDNSAAKQNKELVKKRLEELEKQINEHNKQQDSKPQEKNQNKSSQSDDKNTTEPQSSPEETGKQAPQQTQQPNNEGDNPEDGSGPEQRSSLPPPGQGESPEQSRPESEVTDVPQDPGDMTLEEARQLLKEMEGNQGRLYLLPDNGQSSPPQTGGKDW